MGEAISDDNPLSVRLVNAVTGTDGTVNTNAATAASVIVTFVGWEE